MVAARALVMGCRLDTETLFGHRMTGRMKLPPYAWQRKIFQQSQTTEALDIYGAAARHPLIGARLMSGTPEWRNLIDPTVGALSERSSHRRRDHRSGLRLCRNGASRRSRDISGRPKSGWKISISCNGCRCGPTPCGKSPCGSAAIRASWRFGAALASAPMNGPCMHAAELHRSCRRRRPTYRARSCRGT